MGKNCGIRSHKTSGDHDGRYYTETEIDTKLGGKSNTGHTHDDRYYTESEMDTKLNGKASSGHTHSAATQSAAGLMSANDKKKLDGVATGANAYSHPTGNGNNHIPSGGASGQILRWSSAGTATWGSDNNTTYSAATQSAQGLMSAADKKKLDGITAGANMLKSDIVNNCTSTNTDKPLAANQGKVLMEKFNQLNSDITPVIKSGLTVANSNILIVDTAFVTMGKLCVLSFELTIKATFTSGDLLKLPSGMKSWGTYHFVLDFVNTIKHGWIFNQESTICIQNGAEKTGNIRGTVVFFLV